MKNKKDCCLETSIKVSMLNDYMENIHDQLEGISNHEQKITFLFNIIADYKMSDIEQFEFDAAQMSYEDAIDSSTEE